MVVGGADDSTGDLAAANTMGGIASYPLGQDVVGGSNALGTEPTPAPLPGLAGLVE
ncbi:MAG: hypothetical protein WBM24_11215 [Candidatus Sulfotelmatobacter sp.]